MIITVNAAERRKTQNRLAKRKSRAKEKKAAAAAAAARDVASPSPPTTAASSTSFTAIQDIPYGVMGDTYGTLHTPPHEPAGSSSHCTAAILSMSESGMPIGHNIPPTQGPTVTSDHESALYSPITLEALGSASSVESWALDSTMELSAMRSMQDEPPRDSASSDICSVSGYCKPIQGTPLHIAAALGHNSVAKTLIIHGADINSIDKAGLSPIHYATRNGQTSVVVMLLEHGANVDCVDPEGYTPLYRAAENGNNELVERLLSHGARLR